jgi:hypothetical protein
VTQILLFATASLWLKQKAEETGDNAKSQGATPQSRN